MRAVEEEVGLEQEEVEMVEQEGVEMMVVEEEEEVMVEQEAVEALAVYLLEVQEETQQMELTLPQSSRHPLQRPLRQLSVLVHHRPPLPPRWAVSLP